MKYEESAIIYNKIKETSNLNEEALALLGVTKEKLDDAMQKCISAGMSRKKASEVIYKMWNNAGK